ncbi:hypothetical protein OG594_16670 [Streptomyces sp. NBC_01214]|nr:MULTISPECIES: hypothetical protein [Streptomyces]MCX4803267.1 hypothetical protein [Streptomyces sp. NBC_01214]WSC76134.1 hypothetical protein OHA56_07290 [Streptomyces virginiae]
MWRLPQRWVSWATSSRPRPPSSRHRFYFRERMAVTAFNFGKPLD